jgi:hypothetical protein
MTISQLIWKLCKIKNTLVSVDLKKWAFPQNVLINVPLFHFIGEIIKNNVKSAYFSGKSNRKT